MSFTNNYMTTIDANGSDADELSLREKLGLPAERKFIKGCAPREVNLDEIRAYHEGTLDPELRGEVGRLIVCYKEWHEASVRVLLDQANEYREGR